ncbi:MAG: Na+/H+ antiporter NhaA [Cloacibacterium sp.]|jgi:NhaA family Na+:H+ antiporter|nr:Na+/H+ antiporter NhaA [Cloacibacterium sp.]
MRLTKYFKEFFSSSQSSGILLILCVMISLMIANSSMADTFQNLLDTHLGPYSVSVWVNDGLMAIFFLLVGLEIKRELLEGELSSFKNASLPIFAAIGGMVVPALVFMLFNHGTPYAKGWAIPMATDIAFSLAIVSMLGKGVPASIKVFLAALAIVDDLGAILVIAIFYTDEIHWNYLIYSGIIIALLIALNFFKVKKHIFYLLPGILLWYFMHHSGIHATIAGVLLAFTIPTNKSESEISPLEKLEHSLHFPVSYLIMPIFALANTNITFKPGMVDGLFSNFGYGIVLGLFLGKLLGVNLFSLLAIKLKISSLPESSNWRHMTGVGMLAGIGFTMSIFISLLSYKGLQDIQDEAKFAILVASIIAGTAGFILLKSTISENDADADF